MNVGTSSVVTPSAIRAAINAAIAVAGSWSLSEAQFRRATAPLSAAGIAFWTLGTENTARTPVDETLVDGA